MKGGVVFVVLFAALVAFVHLREPKWKPIDRSTLVPPPAPSAPPAQPKGLVEYEPLDRTEVPHVERPPTRPNGPQIDHAKIATLVLRQSPSSDSAQILTERMMFAMRRARIGTGERGVLTQDDMEFLARFYVETWADYAQRYGSEHRQKSPGEVREQFDLMLAHLLDENDQVVKGNAESDKTQDTVNSVLGEKGNH